jgi:hypothetical protein
MHEHDIGLWTGSRQERDDQNASSCPRPGVTHFDTAEAYGPFANEELVGEALQPIRDKVTIATKFGFDIDLETGKRSGGTNSRPEHVKAVAESEGVPLRQAEVFADLPRRVRFPVQFPGLGEPDFRFDSGAYARAGVVIARSIIWLKSDQVNGFTCDSPCAFLAEGLG